jgi:hypothetical protein
MIRNLATVCAFVLLVSASSAHAAGIEANAKVLAQLDEIKRLFDANVGGFMVEQTAGGHRVVVA